MSNNPALIDAAMRTEKALRNFVEVMNYPADDWMVLSANDLSNALALPRCPTPWEWFTMGHPAIAGIKESRQRILAFVPRKIIPKGAHGQHFSTHPAKLAFVHWSTALKPTKGSTPGKHAQELLDKHGGFWATDKMGNKPLKGAPELWAYLPVIE